MKQRNDKPLVGKIEITRTVYDNGNMNLNIEAKQLNPDEVLGILHRTLKMWEDKLLVEETKDGKQSKDYIG